MIARDALAVFSSSPSNPSSFCRPTNNIISHSLFLINLIHFRQLVHWQPDQSRPQPMATIRNFRKKAEAGGPDPRPLWFQVRILAREDERGARRVVPTSDGQ
jgi:hypothetical protein